MVGSATVGCANFACMLLCSVITDISTKNQTPPTSKTDSAQNFALDVTVKMLLLIMAWPIMSFDAHDGMMSAETKIHARASFPW